MAGEKILVVDDDHDMLNLMRAWLERAGYRVKSAEKGEDALAFAEAEIFNAAVVDLKMKGMDGIAVLEGLLQVQPCLPIIIATAHASIAGAVEATRKGACDFLAKSSESGELLHRLEKALEVGRLKVEVDQLREMVGKRYRFDNIIASSEKMQQILLQVSQIAPTESTVCIYGESGTGKELIAGAIHVASMRAHYPFVAINCGAIPEGLLENELFGHVKGAFTGAEKTKKGLLQQAEGGTLFLDEIAELPLPLQVKLLRVIQEREFYPVGGVQPVKVNLRLVAATNQDLLQAVGEGKFREDLYYRINVIPVHLPPLRERPKDIPPLAREFAHRFSRDMNKRVQEISPEAMQQLMLYHWPGNVRELANVIERAVALTPHGVIADCRFFLGERQTQNHRLGLVSLKEAREDLERAYLTRVLTVTRGNISQAAALAGLYRAEFYRLLRKYATDPGAFKEKREPALKS